MKKILCSLMFLSLLQGCETLGLGGDGASIEDRNAAQSAKKPAASSQSNAAAKPGGAETSALSGSGAMSGETLEGRQLGGGGAGGMDARKDPASPLSKRSIFFDYDSYIVKDDYRSMIEAHAAYLKNNRFASLVLQGNADERGSREYNLALGQKRAEAVRRSFAVLGVRDEQVEAVSFGEEKPRSQGSSEQDYAENRRVDIVYTDE